jgi:hypothetical protein
MRKRNFAIPFGEGPGNEEKELDFAARQGPSERKSWE